MRIWLVTVGEPLPIDGQNVRLYRMGILAGMLSSQGHEVVWWTADFDHIRKMHRFGKDTLVEMNDHYHINLINAVAYHKNVSLQRLLNHYTIGRKFFAQAQKVSPPDIIFCSLPTLELSLASACYGEKNSVPVVLDVRDLWPDIFADVFPRQTRWLAKALLSPYYAILKSACRKARAITGLTDEFVDWGIKNAGRKRTELDRVFPMGYTAKDPDRDAIAAAEEFWRSQGISADKKQFIICFFGTLGRQFDLETVIQAAEILDKKQRGSFRFVICGSGDNFDYYKTLSADNESVVMPGWVDAPKIWTLMRMSSAGLAPYHNIPNFLMNLPNKPIEYLSAGLPIISCLKGVLEKLLIKNDCGAIYQYGSPEDLARVIIELYQNPEKVARMSQNARLLYEREFVAEKVYSDMINYLEQLAML